MTQDHASATQKPHLDDLLTTMGITREQLTGMTADDLFAAATRWQDAASIAAAEARRSRPPSISSSTGPSPNVTTTR
jgi:hypothetical protein